MKLTKQAISLLLLLGATSQTAQAATVWTAQLVSATSTELPSGIRTDLYNLHIVLDEDSLTPPSYTELTVTDIYLDHLDGDASAIDPASLLTTSSADLATTDALDYYLINDLVNHPVGAMSGGVLSSGLISFSFFDANLAQ